MCLFFLVFSEKLELDVSASVIDYVDLTPEQTLALYGNTISGAYWNGSEYDSCTFTYCYTLEPSQINSIQASNNFSSSEKDYINDRKYLVYAMDADSSSHDNIISYADRVTLQLHPVCSISGIAYFRQFIGFSFSEGTNKNLDFQKDSNFGPLTQYNYISSVASYSNVPITTTIKTFTDSGYTCYNVLRFVLPYTAVGSAPSSDSGISATNMYPVCTFFDVKLENIDSQTGQEQTFDFTQQDMNFANVHSVGWSSTVGNVTVRDYHYLVYISCPRVTDGYVLPDSGGENPDYSGVLDDISGGVSQSNTLLQQILAKLDAIYAKMNSQGISISGTVEIGSPSITNIGVAIGNSVSSALRDLFVPTKSQLLSFRLNMENELSSSFPAFYSANTAINNQFGVFHNVSAVSSVRFPGVSLDLPTGQSEQTATFNIAAQDVDLKPASDRLGGLYDALAVIVDIICTLAVFNMFKNRFYRFFEGGASE